MHESFVYSSHSQLPQVTFWHAYRDFFSSPAVVEQLLSASEVIKNVQVAFPAAQAKLLADERGEKKFVIAGLGFRKGDGEYNVALEETNPNIQPMLPASCANGVDAHSVRVQPTPVNCFSTFSRSTLVCHQQVAGGASAVMLLSQRHISSRICHSLPRQKSRTCCRYTLANRRICSLSRFSLPTLHLFCHQTTICDSPHR